MKKEVFSVLSFGENRSEVIPKIGDDVRLLVETNESDMEYNRTELVDVKIEYVNRVGEHYRISGQHVNKLPVVAIYEVDKNYPIGTIIGSLTQYDG